MKNLTNREIEAIKKAISKTDYKLKDEDIASYYGDEITINETRSGRSVAWVIFSESQESAVYVDTLEELTEKEIEDELL